MDVMRSFVRPAPRLAASVLRRERKDREREREEEREAYIKENRWKGEGSVQRCAIRDELLSRHRG